MRQDDLFVDEPVPRRVCAACDLPMEDAPGEICRRCLADPEAAAERAALALQQAIVRQHSAAWRADDAWNALSDEDVVRWSRYQEMLGRRRIGEELPPDLARKLDTTIAAYQRQDVRRLGWALLAMDTAQRLLDEANADLDRAQARYDRQIAALMRRGGVAHAHD